MKNKYNVFDVFLCEKYYGDFFQFCQFWGIIHIQLMNRSICLPEKENNEVDIVVFLDTIFWSII